MSKGAVLTVSLVSGIAAGVAAPTATMPHTTDGLLSEVNEKGAAGEGSMIERSGRIAGACDSLNFVTVMLLSKFVCPDSEICFESNLKKDSQTSGSAKLRIRSSSGMSLVWPPRAIVIRVRVSGVHLFFVV